MKNHILPVFMALIIFISISFASCSYQSDVLHDGYYTAQVADYDEYGWIEYITIYVSGGVIVTVEYDAKNRSGIVKSWDMDYMRAMKNECDTYPNRYTRIFKEALLSRQDPEKVDTVSGATYSYQIFKILAEAAIEKSKAGDKSVAFVNIPQLIS